jgi:uncharacterized phage protein (TIGR01671 family)
MREIKFKIYDKNDTNCIIGPFNWNKLPQFLFPENFTVLQYTGLKDKNGKEVYEGDIVRWGMSHDLKNAFPKLRFVEFCERQLIYKVVEVGDLPSSLDYLYEAKQPSTRWCEVIGNIFENPELLKQ